MTFAAFGHSDAAAIPKASLADMAEGQFRIPKTCLGRKVRKRHHLTFTGPPLE